MDKDLRCSMMFNAFKGSIRKVWSENKFTCIIYIYIYCCGRVNAYIIQNVLYIIFHKYLRFSKNSSMIVMSRSYSHMMKSWVYIPLPITKTYILWCAFNVQQFKCSMISKSRSQLFCHHKVKLSCSFCNYHSLFFFLVLKFRHFRRQYLWCFL